MGYRKVFLILVYLSSFLVSNAQSTGNNGLTPKENVNSEKKVLIITDGINDITLPATAEARELDNLLGHFRTRVSIEGMYQYKPGQINNYDIIFYVGYGLEDQPTSAFTSDALRTGKTFVWINGGLMLSKGQSSISKKLGFTVCRIDSSETYNSVISNNKLFTRDDADLFIVQINNRRKVNVIAYAQSTEKHNETPYIVKSKNFYYVADMPFANTASSDRYLLFADLLHDIIGENHPVSHSAIVRIEDVTPVRDPDRLRTIADILSQRHIPFLIGVVPFYVNPVEGTRISLSDRPELVKALKYCVEKGATIVLHGVTHQYKGISAVDFEFWDGSTEKPIANEDPKKIAQRIETGIDECIKNGIYPLLWETPHYSASISDYKIVSRYFSTAVERRMVNEDFDYGQFFPYVINKDIYGQKIYPEDLGYVPLLEKKDSSEYYVRNMIANAKAIYNVRDGYASFFFHPFLNPTYLKEIVDGISSLGYKFVDLRKQSNWVKTSDAVILSGSQAFRMNLNHAFLDEIYYNKNGEIEKTVLSEKKITGTISKRIMLKPDEFYFAEPLKQLPPSDENKSGKNNSLSAKNNHS